MCKCVCVCARLPADDFNRHFLPIVDCVVDYCCCCRWKIDKVERIGSSFQNTCDRHTDHLCVCETTACSWSSMFFFLHSTIGSGSLQEKQQKEQTQQQHPVIRQADYKQIKSLNADHTLGIQATSEQQLNTNKKVFISSNNQLSSKIRSSFEIITHTGFDVDYSLPVWL